ncbi:hypothetical protein [Corynebacterium sp. HMSC04H06]|uniref:hypothetical protein n=1 Tax=Corynebacterium sp. HMSC04H06 TaxID=1581050 RepID=UPI0008D6E9DE|nr:hypothetical protein [Corynebacterium sp. HMSC04H06]OFS20157.1 hypothetical protein HMPREF3067_07870 [Corynebacterium sp. HMSC04H06]
MPEFEFDHTDIVARLGQVSTGVSAQRQAHLRRVPEYPQAAAGRDFAGHGQRIQQLLNRLHELGGWRINNMDATVRAAADQFTAVYRGDDAFGARLGQGDDHEQH